MTKKLNILIIIFFLTSIFIHAYNLYSENLNKNINKGNLVYFILLKGRGFKHPDINSHQLPGVKLRFGEAIRFIKKERYENLTWYKCINDDGEFYLPETFVDEKKFSDYQLDLNGNIVIGTAEIDRVYSIPLDYIPTDLVSLNNKIKAKGYEWRKLRLRVEAKTMFERMIHDAEASGVNIFIISSFRDSKYQSMLYTRAIKRHGINENSVAKPGHSEHQLGTACDLTSDEVGYALSKGFEKSLAYEWLTKNSWRYGIFLTYPRLKQRITGYTYEPWHYRYWGKDHWNKIFSKYRIMLR